MTELNAQAQMIELTDDQLELVSGCGRYEDVKTMAPLVPIINGPINILSQWLGGPSIEVSI